MPTTRPDKPREIGFAETVSPFLPRETVVSAIGNAVGTEPRGLESSWGSDFCGDRDIGPGLETTEVVMILLKAKVPDSGRAGPEFDGIKIRPGVTKDRGFGVEVETCELGVKEVGAIS